MGSTILNFTITEDLSQSTSGGQQQTLEQLNNITNTIQVGASSLDIGGVGTVTGVTTQVIVVNPDGSQYVAPVIQDTKDNTVAIVVGVVVGVLAAVALSVGIFFIVRKFKNRIPIGSQSNVNESGAQLGVVHEVSDMRGINVDVKESQELQSMNV